MAFLYIPALFLLILYISLIAYYHKGFRQLKNYESIFTKGITKVTIIIPARNEAQNISYCLNAIKKQNYAASLLQVIVVDDFSTDATATIVQSFAPMVQLLQLKKFITEKETNSFKKKAIDIAIQHATCELIICTDADCIMTENWVSNIVSYYEKTNAQFIAAPVCLTPNLSPKEKGATFATQKTNRKWKVVELFQTLDFTTLQGITAASVFKNFYTMCNGANLAYTKKAFIQVKGFEGIDNIASGDDMLLMHKIKEQFPNQVMYLKSKNAIVQSLTVPTWKAFFTQRIRWSSKASHYDDKNILFSLMLVYFLNVATLLLIISLLFTTQYLTWVVMFIAVKAIMEYWFLQPVLHFFGLQFLKKWFIPFIPIHLIYIIVAGFFGKFGKSNWKGRTV